MEMEATSFDDLLHDAEQLTIEMDGESELPRVERNLRQLLEAGEQLWTRTASGTSRDTTDVRASVLLGSKGYDLQKVTQQLDTLSAVKKLTPIETIADTDIKGFLRNERENAIMKIINDVKTVTIESADKLYLNNLQHEWEEEKLKILNALVGPDEHISDFTSSFDMTAMRSQSSISPVSTPKPKLYFEQSLIDTSNITAMNPTETAFAKEIIKYVDQTVFGAIRANIANIFYNKVAKEVIGETLIIDLWEMVSTLLSDDLPLVSNSDAFANRNNHKLQLSLIKHSRQFLEKKFVESVQGTLYGEPRPINQNTAVLYNLIKNYLNIKSPLWSINSFNTSYASSNITTTAEDGLVDGQPIWCFIWHCLRAGSVEAAIHVAEKGPVWVNKEFIPILHEYRQSEEKRLSQKTENQIKLLYKKTIRLSNDVYKRTVFSLLGCCGINDFQSDVFDKVDDFLWLRLSQIQIYEKDIALHESFTSLPSPVTSSDSLTFSSLQHQISEEYGESHFHAQEQPFTYFKALFLTLQWETAIEFLFRIDSYRSHAIHIAIALNEMGLLLIPSLHLKVPLLSRQAQDPPKLQRINYVKLINIFTRKFEANNSVEAIYYFYLLRNIKTSAEENLFVTSVSALVRNTKNYDTLLGYMGEDGCRIPGVIDKFHDDVLLIIDQVASDLENNGLFEDAVKLYDLESKHNKVLQLLNTMLSSVVPERKVQDSKRTRLETLALKLAERYCANGHNADRSIAGTFFLLLDLMTFFDYYHNQQYNDAFDTINKLKILPFKNVDIDIKVNEFSQYAEELRRNIPDILLATMNILYSQYKEMKSLTPRAVNKFGIVGDVGNRDQLCNEIRLKARTLITYAGMIPYRMPGDTNARLVQLEVMMN